MAIVLPARIVHLMEIVLSAMETAQRVLFHRIVLPARIVHLMEIVPLARSGHLMEIVPPGRIVHPTGIVLSAMETAQRVLFHRIVLPVRIVQLMEIVQKDLLSGSDQAGI